MTTKTPVPGRSDRRARTLLRGFLVIAAVIVLAAETMARTGTAVLVLEVSAAVVVACAALFALASLLTAALLALAVRRGLRRMHAPDVTYIGRRIVLPDVAALQQNPSQSIMH